MNELSNWLPLVISVVGLVGGAVIYQIQKATDRRNQILQERRELYRKVVVATRQMLASWFDNSDKQKVIAEHVQFTTLIAELLVCAPDEVIRAIKALESAVRDALIIKLKGENLLSDFDATNMQKGQLSDQLAAIENAYDDAVFAMRKDTFGDSELTRALVATILEGFPISVGIRLP